MNKVKSNPLYRFLSLGVIKALCTTLLTLSLISSSISGYSQEAYAVVSEDGTTLTFYYDTERATRAGTAYDLNEGEDVPEWAKGETNGYPDNPSFNKVIFDISFKEATPTTCFKWFAGFKNLKTIDNLEFLNTSEVTNMSYMFYFCSNLTDLDLSHFDTQNVTNMRWMFCLCKNITSLDLTNFNTTKVTDMELMFDACRSLTTLDVSKFDTQNVTSMERMFDDCSSLTTLDVSKFNTQNVDDMQHMFYGCSSLTTLDLSNFNTENVKFMSSMFCGCSNLTNLDLSAFDTQKVSFMDFIFKNCSNLTTLDLSGFQIQLFGSIKSMFSNCSNLTTIYVSEEFRASRAYFSDNMFEGCTSLKGGNGTVYDANHIDQEYARIDKSGEPGYFTDKNATLTPIAETPKTADHVNVWSSSHTIYINAPTDTKYIIIDTNGRLITTSTTKSSHEEIKINKSGILIVIIDNQSFKLAL